MQGGMVATSVGTHSRPKRKSNPGAQPGGWLARAINWPSMPNRQDGPCKDAAVE